MFDSYRLARLCSTALDGALWARWALWVCPPCTSAIVVPWQPKLQAAGMAQREVAGAAAAGGPGITHFRECGRMVSNWYHRLTFCRIARDAWKLSAADTPPSCSCAERAPRGGGRGESLYSLVAWSCGGPARGTKGGWDIPFGRLRARLSCAIAKGRDGSTGCPACAVCAVQYTQRGRTRTMHHASCTIHRVHNANCHAHDPGPGAHLGDCAHPSRPCFRWSGSPLVRHGQV